MRIRPWPIVILAILHILEPVFRLSLNWMYGISPEVYMNSLYYSKFGFFKVLTFFLFPMAGIAIFMFKKWSLWVFLFIEAIVLALNVNTSIYYIETAQYGRLITSIVLYVLNIGVVVYFLVPSVRKFYEDSTMRWWESAVRYDFELDCELIALEDKTGKRAKVHTKNLSRSGMFFESDDELAIDSNESLPREGSSVC